MFVAETCIVSKTRENIMGLDNTQQFYLDHADWIMPTVLFGTCWISHEFTFQFDKYDSLGMESLSVSHRQIV